MNKTILWLGALLPVLLAACAVTHNGPSPVPTETARLEMRTNYLDLDDAKFGDRKAVLLNVEIRNVSQTTVMLPTKDIGPALITDGGITSVLFSPDGYLSTRDGFKIPVAKSDLAIVELRPKEAISLNHEFEKPMPVIGIVYYSISPEFAARYGTWSGKIDTMTNAVKK